MSTEQPYSVINDMDEQERFRSVKFYITGIPGQYNSHGYSYLHARIQYQSMGDQMGFDVVLSQEQEARLRIYE